VVIQSDTPNLDKPQDSVQYPFEGYKYLHEMIFCKIHRKSLLRYYKVYWYLEQLFRLKTITNISAEGGFLQRNNRAWRTGIRCRSLQGFLRRVHIVYAQIPM